MKEKDSPCFGWVFATCSVLGRFLLRLFSPQTRFFMQYWSLIAPWKQTCAAAYDDLIFTLHCSQWVVFVVDNVMEHFSSGSQSMLGCEHIIGHAIACCCCCSVIKKNKPTTVYLFYTIRWHSYREVPHCFLTYLLWSPTLFTDIRIKSHYLLTFLLWNPTLYWHLYCEVPQFTDVHIVKSQYLLTFAL